MNEIETFRHFHQQRFQKLANEIEKKRQHVISMFPKIATVFKQMNAEKVIVFGSVLSQKRFRFYSDLDILVYGLKDSQWLEVFKHAEKIEELKDISFDIKLAQDVKDDFKDFVLNHCEHVCIVQNFESKCAN